MNWATESKWYGIVIIALIVLSAIGSGFSAIRARRFGIKYVKIKDLLCGVIALGMGALFSYGWFRYPDAPISRCNALVGYCGKQGQPHSLSDYQAFEFWQRSLFIVWPIGMLALFLLTRKKLMAMVPLAIVSGSDERFHSDAQFSDVPMARWFESVIWWGSTPAEFESSFGLSESVERLRAATRRWIFLSLAREEAVGIVTESNVSLRRVIPMVGNSFKPFYVGRFVEKNGKVTLVGKFTIHWLTKVFMTFWFGGVACFVLLSFVAALRSSKNAFVPLFGIGMLAFGMALVGLCKRLARNDATWLSNLIRSAICASDTHTLIPLSEKLAGDT